MALTTQQRSTVYEHFAPLLGEEVAEALVSQFPVNDLEVPATKDFVRAECIALKSDIVHEIGALRTETLDQIGALRTEVKGEINDLRTEVKDEINDLRTELKDEINDLRTEVQRELRLHLVATVTLVGALLTAFRIL